MAAVDTPAPSVFTPEKFLEDFKRTADALDSPYSESVLEGTLKNFDECLREGTVTWRGTSRANDVLNYRFYIKSQLDTVDLAVKAGYIKADDPMARLATSWSKMYNGNTVQWVDLDPKDGVAKTWILMKGQRPIDDILDADEVPESVRAHRSTFHNLGLKLVHFTAVDYHGGTLNIYFTAPGSITKPQAAAYAALAQCKPPTDEEFEDFEKFIPPQRFAFAVTMKYKTGEITRVSFYALNIPEGPLPATANDRLRKFFAEAPSYDEKRTRTFGWSYGVGDKKYMKGESSYTGNLQTWVQNVRGPVSEELARLLDDARSSMKL